MGSVFTINYDGNDKPITKRIITVKIPVKYFTVLFVSMQFALSKVDSTKCRGAK